MKPIVNQIHKSLIKNKKTIAVAESCTAGMVSAHLTQLPDSSKYFILAIVAYSNKAKEKLLGIPHSLIAEKGAVSAAVAKKMAQAIKKIAKTDLGIGITGIAGPGGGSANKPVGTVFIALANQNKTPCRRFHFRGNRATVRKKATLKSLELLKNIL